ncbi:hypothetical protein [Catenulispora acidiphila]|uniref:hypothetical protein n=1 Tax=Catenulispora acidiphila TaxID=304895 RepID=UPI00019DF595|nr:hypothetical protein [Catenulispora acidiphila]
MRLTMRLRGQLAEFGGLPVAAYPPHPDAAWFPGAAAPLAGQPPAHLRTLDLRHHFISAEMRNRLRAAWPGVDIDLSLARSDSPRPRAGAVAE